MIEMPEIMDYSSENKISKIVAIFIGSAIAIAGGFMWYLLTILRITFQSPQWVPWLHTAVVTTFILLYVPIGFIALYSTFLLIKNVSKRLNNEDLPSIPSRRVNPHRFTRKVAANNSKNLEKVSESTSANSGALLTLEDLDDILFDIPRNPLKSILTDHLPRMLFMKKGRYADLSRSQRFLHRSWRYFVTTVVTVGIGFIAWKADVLIFYVALISSVLCQVLMLAFWEHSRVRYILTTNKLGYIEARLFFGGNTQPFVRTKDITQVTPRQKGFGEALQHIHIGWGDIDFRTTEQEEVWDNLHDVSDPDLVCAYISAVSPRTQTTAETNQPNTFVTATDESSPNDSSETQPIHKVPSVQPQARRRGGGRPPR